MADDAPVTYVFHPLGGPPRPVTAEEAAKILNPPDAGAPVEISSSAWRRLATHYRRILHEREERSE